MAVQRLEIVALLHQALHDSKLNKPVGSVSIPIWTIATGTVNYDMIITKGTVALAQQAYIGRLSFEVKMFQALKYSMRCRKLIVKMKKKLGERYYKFNFYVFVAHANQDGQKRTPSYMSTLYENLYLNQATYKKKESLAEKEEHDSFDSDKSLSSAMSIRSEDFSDMGGQESAKLPPGRIPRTDSELSLSNLKPMLKNKSRMNQEAMEFERFDSEPNQMGEPVESPSKFSFNNLHNPHNPHNPHPKLPDSNHEGKVMFWSFDGNQVSMKVPTAQAASHLRRRSLHQEHPVLRLVHGRPRLRAFQLRRKHRRNTQSCQPARRNLYQLDQDLQGTRRSRPNSQR